jgi:peptidoglycan hydrolase-like protein with peptidoglycan-binding domain
MTTTTTISAWPLVRQGARQHPVQTFQRQRALAVDGIAGPATWPALIITVMRGSQGDAVRGVQEEFQFRNLSGGPGHGLPVDGIFGPTTEAAVRGIQQTLHRDIPSVTVDGIAGPITWRALVSGMLSL